jgi:hypothetical protein
MMEVKHEAERRKVKLVIVPTVPRKAKPKTRSGV